MSPETNIPFENNLGHRSFILAREIELIEDEEILKKKLPELLDSMEEDLGLEFTNDVKRLYLEMEKEKCLIRVENLSEVLGVIEEDKTLHISDINETHYANAVIPVPEGIKIAFSEGQAPGPIRLAIAFGKTIIGFKTDHITVDEIDFNKDDVRGSGERKFLCRHVVGDLKRDDICYLIMRIPRPLFTEEYLDEDEKDGKSQFIFRGLKI